MHSYAFMKFSARTNAGTATFVEINNFFPDDFLRKNKDKFFESNFSRKNEGKNFSLRNFFEENEKKNGSHAIFQEHTRSINFSRSR